MVPRDIELAAAIIDAITKKPLEKNSSKSQPKQECSTSGSNARIDETGKIRFSLSLRC